MRGGIENLAWLNDKDGREFVCYEEDVRGKNSFEELNDKEKSNCENVNQFIGTERW